jgi:prophage regulatory protein
MADRILRLPEVKSTTGLPRSTIYARIHEGSFPKPICLGCRSVGWLESEIQDWVRRKVELARSSQ